MRRLAAPSVVLLSFVLLASAQTKPWTEWSKKDVEKTLSDSAWSQTQTETPQTQPTNAAAVTQTMAGRNEDRNLNNAGRTESGEAKSVQSVKYYVRFLSAKPVRAAFARKLMLAQAQPNKELQTQLQTFVDRDFSDYIVVVVSPEVTDERVAGALTRAFAGATTEALQQSVYLERKDGKRLFLTEYRVPINDGLGAKFVFKRTVDGRAFLDESDTVRFFAQLNEKLKLNTRYKVSEMMYDGRLEY